MPFIVLLGLGGLGSGIFALISLSFRFSGLLYTTKGAWGNTCARYGSCLIVLQCLLTILDMEGSLGSKDITNTGLFEFCTLITFFRASDLGIYLAF